MVYINPCNDAHLEPTVSTLLFILEMMDDDIDEIDDGDDESQTLLTYGESPSCLPLVSSMKTPTKTVPMADMTIKIV